MSAERVIAIRTDADIVAARQEGRALGDELGFSPTDCTLIATAISEVSRNIIEYAGVGELVVRPTQNPQRRGLQIVARDNGPGIANVELALTDGYSTGNSLGLGLPGARRLVDTLEISTSLGEGTTVVLTKWL